MNNIYDYTEHFAGSNEPAHKDHHRKFWITYEGKTFWYLVPKKRAIMKDFSDYCNYTFQPREDPLLMGDRSEEKEDL